jgi:hypothetical protein
MPQMPTPHWYGRWVLGRSELDLGLSASWHDHRLWESEAIALKPLHGGVGAVIWSVIRYRRRGDELPKKVGRYWQRMQFCGLQHPAMVFGSALSVRVTTDTGWLRVVRMGALRLPCR